MRIELQGFKAWVFVVAASIGFFDLFIAVPFVIAVAIFH